MEATTCRFDAGSLVSEKFHVRSVVGLDHFFDYGALHLLFRCSILGFVELTSSRELAWPNRELVMKNLYLLFCIVVALSSLRSVDAHPWHTHTTIDEVHDDGVGVGFTIPQNAGDAPTNSEAVARIAESVAHFQNEGVSYRWDDDYFYIESDGVPSHPTIAGITMWQQQIGLPQNYSGDNSFRIPLNPQLSDSPLSVLTNIPPAFTAAMGVAVNGIPIFPAYNNRIEDTVAIGEVDDFGGHSGRGDDYHYHGAPLHLVDIVGIENPIAYGFDGFPLYGLPEAHGSEVMRLDEFNGQFDDDGNYHYHATEEFPYHFGGLRGEIETDPQSGRVIQPRDSPVRSAGTPLRGAEVTTWEQLSENGYAVTYELSGQEYLVEWSWDVDTRDIVFSFTDPDGAVDTEVYAGRYQPLPNRAKAELSIVDVSEEGIATISIEGEPGFGFQLQTSIDGENWRSFGHALVDESGISLFELALEGELGYLRAFEGEAAIVGTVCDPNTLGDIDGNGTVAFEDFLILSENFGQEVSSHARGDIDCNGVVEFGDFLSLSANLGRMVGSEAVSVPEPTGWLLAALVGLLGVRQTAGLREETKPIKAGRS